MVNNYDCKKVKDLNLNIPVEEIQTERQDFEDGSGKSTWKVFYCIILQTVKHSAEEKEDLNKYCSV